MDEVKANHFLKMIRRSAHGRLKIYLGYCAGVGKTYRMLQEGQMLRSEGIDVVAGYIETHGRSDIEKLMNGLEIIPRITREYKGIQLEEMDVAAIIIRKPAVALVDELAHNDVPGSRNMKRYQDVQEILAAGIHVITTLNVQHLESLYNTVEQLVGVRVRERLPDTIIAEADQIVNVDLSSEDLRKRLEEGKIYQKERIQEALANFFTASNLEKLRELTLRELAAQIDTRRKEPLPEEISAMPDQVLVCLSSRGPSSELLLRYASRFAGRLNKNWYALYVQRDAENPTQIDMTTQIALSNTLTLAKQLGAIVFTYRGEDLASTILRFAREYRIGHIVIGTPSKLSFLARLRQKKSLAEKLIQKAEGITIVVVNTSRQLPTADQYAQLDPKKETPRQILLSDFLHEQNIVVWKDIPMKEEVLRDLAKAAYGDEEDLAEIHQAIELREKESSTFFNEGVAFPHVRIEGDFPPKLALGFTPRGIANLSTLQPIRLIFLIISSVQQIEIQAKLLAVASKIASNKPLLDTLLSAKTPQTIIREIGRWEHDSLTNSN